MKDVVEKKITERYGKNTDSGSMGCAILDPFFDFKDGDAVLELGSGNGRQAINISDLVGENGLVIGLDLTDEMVRKAVLMNDKKNVSFIKGDIHDLPFENRTFDAVISNCVINHSKDKKKVYGEIYRVLKKNGYFLIGDVMSVEKLPDEISNDPACIAECWGGAVLKEEYFSVIKASGFENILELSKRRYNKNGFPMESVVLKGVKK